MKHNDVNGERLLVGDRVVLLAASAALLADLPREDQAAIKAQVGKSLGVAGFDKYGYVELTEFTDSDGTIHTIWVEPEYLRKVTTE